MPNKRGAPKGNHNALKHGIFSQFIRLGDDKAMKGMSNKDPKDDLAMARVNFTSAMKERVAAVDTKDKLAWDIAVHYWFESIINIKLRAKEEEQIKATVWETFSDALRAANDRQGVQ